MDVYHGWHAKAAAHCPLMEYLRGIAPVGSLFHIDTEQVAHHMKYTNLRSVSSTLFQLQEIGVLKYFAEKGSRDIAIRILS